METNPFQQDYEIDDAILIKPKGHDFEMFVTPRFREEYELNDCEPLTSSLLINKLENTEVFVDIGADYGYYSLLVAKHHPTLPIISYEPVPENFKILQKNIKANQFSNILAINKAVSNFTGETEMNKTLASDNCSFIRHPACSTFEKITVQTISLNDLLQENKHKKVTIKIGVEGTELDILQNARDLLEKNDNISLFVEFNPKCLLAAGHAPDELLKFFALIDFDIFAIEDTAKAFYKIENHKDWKTYLSEEADFINLYCVRKNKVKNILVFSHSSSIGGAELSLNELVRELTLYYDCLCTVILPGTGPQFNLLMEHGVATISAPLNWWCRPEKLCDDAINKDYLETYSWITEHIGQIEKIKPDVITTNTIVIPWGAVVAKMLSIPHIWSIHEFGQQDHGLVFYQRWEEIHDYIIRHSDRITTCSGALQKELFPDRLDSVDVVYHHLEQSKGNNLVSDTTSLYISDSSIHLFMLGFIRPSKGQEDAVKATIKLVNQDALNVELVIMGDTDQQYENYLYSIIRDNHAVSFIHKHEFKTNFQNALVQADIFLMCSRREAFGRVTIEAMLDQIPVIGTNTGGTPEIIDDNRTGLLYSPGNFMELSEKIKYLVQNPKIADELGKNGKKSVLSRFTIENYGGKVNRIIQEVLEKNIDKPFSPLSNNLLNRLLIEDFKAKIALLSNAEQAVQKLETERCNSEELARQLDLISADKRQILNSTSWKITLPLRKLGSFLRALKRKLRGA